MSRLKLIGLGLVAVVAYGALAVASASAEAPEVGRCVVSRGRQIHQQRMHEGGERKKSRKLRMGIRSD